MAIQYVKAQRCNVLIEELLEEYGFEVLLKNLFHGKEKLITERFVVERGAVGFIKASVYYKGETDDAFLSGKHSDLVRAMQGLQDSISKLEALPKTMPQREQVAIHRLAIRILKAMISDIQRTNAKLIEVRLFPNRK